MSGLLRGGCVTMCAAAVLLPGQECRRVKGAGGLASVVMRSSLGEGV